MTALSPPPSGLVVLVRILGLGVAALGWLLGLLVFVVAFPFLPMLASSFGGFLWLLSLVLTPAFAFFAVRRFKDMTWNGVVDPLFAAGLGGFCGLMGTLALQQAASIEIA